MEPQTAHGRTAEPQYVGFVEVVPLGVCLATIVPVPLTDLVIRLHRALHDLPPGQHVRIDLIS